MRLYILLLFITTCLFEFGSLFFSPALSTLIRFERTLFDLVFSVDHLQHSSTSSRPTAVVQYTIQYSFITIIVRML